MSAVSQQL